MRNSAPRLQWSQSWLHLIANGNRDISVHHPWNLTFVADFGSTAALEVINGTYVAMDGMNEYLVEFLDTMKMPDSIHAKGPLNCLVDAIENRAAWKKQQENIAGEPSRAPFLFLHH